MLAVKRKSSSCGCKAPFINTSIFSDYNTQELNILMKPSLANQDLDYLERSIALELGVNSR